MIIFVSAQGKKSDSPLNPRFGRTPFLVKYDTETEQWEGFENPSQFQSGGAGVAAAQFLVDHQANIAISGRFGPNAYQSLAAAGIQMFTFKDSGQSVRHVIEAYQNGDLEEQK